MNVEGRFAPVTSDGLPKYDRMVVSIQVDLCNSIAQSAHAMDVVTVLELAEQLRRITYGN